MKKLLIPILSFLSYCSYGQGKLSIHFDFNKFDLTATAIHQLDSLIDNSLGFREITLSGHCDSIGNHAYNDQLALKRVAAVKNYFLNKTVLPASFKEEGFGKRMPLNGNETADQRSLNRRVVIYFVAEEKKEETKTVITQTDTTVTSLLETKLKDSSFETGANIVLKNLNFIGGRHRLMPGSESVLGELLEVMKKHPSLIIEIEGHICCQYNGVDGLDFDTQTNNLSFNRAKAVYDYLVENGIDATRLSYKGFSSTRPLFYPERNEHEKTANRRVEIKIISK